MTHDEVLNEVNVIYERVSNHRNDLFGDGNYVEALETLIDYYEVGLIEELKKIKAEILEEDSECLYEEDYIYCSGLEKAMVILDKHISELKGENE